ncbi:MAG: ABC transporter ATP-binding protein [Propionibacteriaceae bacterium]
MTALLEVSELSVRFGARPVLQHVSFAVPAGGRLGLIGESGSGKSVTALAIMGLLPDSATASGSVCWRGTELVGRPESALARLRGRELAMVFQEPMTALDPTMRIGRQVAEVVRLHRHHRTAGLDRPPAVRTRDVVLDVLDRVGLPDPLRAADRYPFQLSGGQRQRVVLAMALVNEPDLIICDEPTTALDVTVQARVLQLLDEVLTASGAACLFISHDLAVVSQVCGEVLVLRDGAVVESGPSADVLARPQHPYTAGLVATARLDDVRRGERLPTLADFLAPEEPR